MSDKPEPLSAVIAETRKSLADDSWIDEITALDEDGKPDDFARRVVPLESALEAIDRIEAAVEREQASLEDALSHCREYAEKIERENEEGETRLDAEEIIATVDNEFAGIRPARAPGNAAATRDALNRVGRLANDLRNITERDTEVRADANEIVDICRSAIAAPARNCDVGTAEEQAERHERFCAAHYKADAVDAQCFGCPASDKKETDCEFVWGQLPFAPAEGGAK